MKNLSNIFLLLFLTLLSCSDNKTSLMMKVDDPEPVISESCEVAIDLLEWVESKKLDYDD